MNPFRSLYVSLGMLGLLMSNGLTNAPSQTLVAPSQPPDFRPLVREAIRQGQARLVIPPGAYRLAPEGGNKLVWPLKNVHDLAIFADGVTLVSTVLTRAIDLDHCENVTLQGLTLDYDPLPFTQGTVVAVAEDKGWVDVKIHAGYPRQPYSRVDVVDPRTRFRKKGMPFLWGTKAAMVSEDTVRVSYPKIGDTAVVGDYLSMSTGPDYKAGGIAHAVTLTDCADTVFRNVTVHTAPGMGIIEGDGPGRSKFLGCQIVPGPPPGGATEARLLSTTWDAMQSAVLRQGPLVEDCVIERAGDDSWSVQSTDYVVVKKAAGTLSVVPRNPYTSGLQVGNRIRLSLDSPEAKIVACKTVSLEQGNLDPEILDKLKQAKPWSFWALGKKCEELTLDGDFSAAVGDSVYSPDRQGAGFVFRHNQLHSSGRVLIEAGEGLIEGNVLDTAHALVVNPDASGKAASGIRHLVIRNNVIRETGYFCPAPWSSQAGAISITNDVKTRDPQRPKTYADITIENNVFSGINGPNIVLNSAQNVTIRGNQFIDAQQTPPNPTGRDVGIPNDCVIWLRDCERVTLADNQIIGLGTFAKHVLTADDSVKALTETGTQIVEKKMSLEIIPPPGNNSSARPTSAR